jgi:hypothetical protein
MLAAAQNPEGLACNSSGYSTSRQYEVCLLAEQQGFQPVLHTSLELDPLYYLQQRERSIIDQEQVRCLGFHCLWSISSLDLKKYC